MLGEDLGACDVTAAAGRRPAYLASCPPDRQGRQRLRTALWRALLRLAVVSGPDLKIAFRRYRHVQHRPGIHAALSEFSA